MQYRRTGFNIWIGKIPWRSEWLLTQVFLLENVHGRIPWTEELHGLQSMGSKELTQLRDFHFHFTIQEDDLPGGTGGKELACQSSRQKRHRFSLWVRKIFWRRAWHPIPVFLPGKFHGQRSLVGWSPWGCKESDMTKRLSMHTRRYL